jgi:REP element-mobilizing transposase RayT
MSLRYPEQKNFTCFFITTTFSRWRKFGNIKGVYERLADSLVFCCEKYQANISGYVFMPSHLHVLLFIEGSDLGNFMRDFKKYIAQKAFRDLDIVSKDIWNEGYDRIGVVSRKVFITKLEYIHNNPVKSGLVRSPEEWRWSSAGDYYTENTGVIKVYKDW